MSCFNIGENLKNRQIVTITDTECLLIPLYWLLENNEANIWVRIKQFLSWQIPNTEKIIQILADDTKWHRKSQKIACRKMKRNVETINIHQIPYSLKV